MKQTTCCFSGYRPEKMPAGMSEDSARFQEMRRQLRTSILRASELGYTSFLCGMSRGFDLWAAEVVLELQDHGLDIALCAAIAFHGMDEYWEPAWRSRYQTALRRARYTFAMFESHCPGCYSVRDQFLVDHSSRLICFFDGVPGGTQCTVHSAQAAGLEIVNLALPQTGATHSRIPR